jgi:hypothetical protein
VSSIDESQEPESAPIDRALERREVWAVPNQHENSRLMRVQNETFEKIKAIGDHERRAANAQLAVIVDEWMAWNGWEVSVPPNVRPARKDTAARPPAATARRVAPVRA